jgi:7-carboxy-7-deazaguanine synthase
MPETQMVKSTESGVRLRITEIFYSLQGESRNIGLPTVFVRLTGCPLRCKYCDTDYAFSGGEWMDVATIIETLKQYNTRHVTVTGGEPLAQKNCNELLTRLCDLGYDTGLETSGAIAVDAVDQRVVKILDIKTPGSGEDARNMLDNLSFLTERDQVKFVICDENDYIWSRQFINEHRLPDRCEILFSPSYGQLDASTLADWILQDQLNVRFQIQLHKYLWGDKPGV